MFKFYLLKIEKDKIILNIWEKNTLLFKEYKIENYFKTFYYLILAFFFRKT